MAILWTVIREADDVLAKTRVSIGSVDLHNEHDETQEGAYLVFRGDPKEIIRILEESVSEARRTLLGGGYLDKRGRPQG